MPEKAVELVEGLVLKPGTHGRRTYSLRAKRALVELSKAPGISVAGLAMAHGINANLLRRWISQCTAESGGVHEPVNQRRVALMPVAAPAPKAAISEAPCERCIEITFKSFTVRVCGAVDAKSLGTVLDCLEPRV